MVGFITFLYRRLLEPLPGFSAQQKMMPKSELKTNHLEESPDSARSSSVLILLQTIENETQVLLTLRSSTLSTHKGQISFPGGKLDEFESFEDAAIREAFEEVGIPPERVSLIGRLSSFYLIHTNMHIQPIVGYLSKDYKPDFILCEEEVEEAFWTPLSTLASDEVLKNERWKLKEVEFSVPFWDIHSNVPLWGATAMMLSELMDLYHEYLSNANPTYEKF